jgi:hypothetical protein
MSRGPRRSLSAVPQPCHVSLTTHVEPILLSAAILDQSLALVSLWVEVRRQVWVESCRYVLGRFSARGLFFSSSAI